MKTHLIALVLGLFTLMLAGGAGAQEGRYGREDGANEKTLSPYFFVEGNAPGVEAFPLESTEVEANVSGVVADVVVKQTYRNDGALPINVKYVFPASTRAAVHGMQMRVGGARVIAKIKEKQQAQVEFAQAQAEGKTASLLEEQRPNVFTMRVANVMPKDRVEVELRYSELLVPEEGTYQFMYPTVVGPRYSNMPESQAGPDDTWVKSPYLKAGVTPPQQTFKMEVNLSTGMPLSELGSNSHKLAINWESKALAHVKIADEGFAGDRDFMLNYRLEGKQIQSGLLLYEGLKDKHFLLMVQPPERVAVAEIPNREYLFVLDVSGSMHGFPLDTAKVLIGDLIAHLGSGDSFNVMLFAGDSQLMSPTSIPATRANVSRAIAFIDAQNGGGGTELEAALRRVVSLPRAEHVSRSVVVLTDGYIAEEMGAFKLIADNLKHTNFFSFGIGPGVNRYLIEGIARAGQGEAFVTTTPETSAATAEQFRRYISTPVLTDISVDYKGFKAYDVEPRSQPDLFAERPIVLFGKYKGEKSGVITVKGRTRTGEFKQSFDVAQTVARPENAALPQLWARTRIARLSDFNFEDDETTAAKAVTKLGLEYSLLTRYTSFIAVLDQVRNPEGNAQNVDQPLPLPQGVSNLAVGGEQYYGGDEPELWLLLSLLSVALAFSVVRRRMLQREQLA